MRSFLKDMTDFIFVSDQPQEADIIFIPGGSYGAICCTAANLWQRNFAPYILPSGRYSKLSGKFSGPSEEDFLLPFTKDTAKMAFSTEYDYFHALLHQAGIPENAISQGKSGHVHLRKCTFFPKSNRPSRDAYTKGYFMSSGLSRKTLPAVL